MTADPIQARAQQILETQLGNLIVSLAQVNAQLEAKTAECEALKAEIETLKIPKEG